MPFKVHVDGLGIVEAESAADIQALREAFGTPSKNGHAAATEAPVDPAVPPASELPALPRKSPRTRRHPRRHVRRRVRPSANVPVKAAAAARGEGKRYERARASDKHRDFARPAADAPREERILYLAAQRTPVQDALYKLLLKIPDGVSDGEGRSLLKLTNGQFSGMIMSISRDANALGLKIDEDVVLRKLSWGGGKRSYQYILRDTMREALMKT